MGVRRESNRPNYSLEEAKRLAGDGKVMISRRPRWFITERVGRCDLKAFVSELFDALEPEDFYKSEELDVLPGTWADVYRPVPFLEPESGVAEDWYIKFYIEGGDVRLHVMSANYDGYIH